MSHQAVTWVLDNTPQLDPGLALTLLVLAEHADDEGRGAFPSQATLARRAHKTERAVRNDLTRLERLGLVSRGDQSRTARMPANRRPVVWDLAITRGEVGDRSHTSGGKWVTGHSLHLGGKPTSAKPSLNRQRKSAREAETEELRLDFIKRKINEGWSEEEARELWWYTHNRIEN